MLLRSAGARVLRSLNPCTFTCARPAAFRAMPLRAKVSTVEGQVKAMSTAVPSSSQEQPQNPEDEVLFHTNYGVRSIQLNRPKVHNSLNRNMVVKILERLREYEKSQLANIIVIKGAGEKAFCAGGDVVELAMQNFDSSGNPNPEGIARSSEFFQREYTLNHLIATYSKPYVAFMDGYTMGGGVGLSIHAPFRIATEKTKFAMPETKIGFFTDVGGSFFLPRMDGHLGMYLALTGEMLKGVDCLYAGIATHYLHSSSLPDVEARLAELHFPDSATLEEKYEIVDSTIEEYNTGLPDAPFSLSGEKRELIEECFSPQSLSGILTALSSHRSNTFIESTESNIRLRCPLSILITHDLLRNNATCSISDCFQHESIVASRFMQSPDFIIGVTSLLVAKQTQSLPNWKSPPLDTLISYPEDAEKLRETFLYPKEGEDERLDLGGGRGGADYTRYPHWWIGLPSEWEIMKKVRGDGAGKAGKAGMTREDLVQYFIDTRRGKEGVKRKVEDVLERKTTIGKDGEVCWNDDPKGRYI